MKLSTILYPEYYKILISLLVFSRLKTGSFCQISYFVYIFPKTYEVTIDFVTLSLHFSYYNDSVRKAINDN